MDIALARNHEAPIYRKVREGKFAVPGDVVREALSLLEEQEQLCRLWIEPRLP